jgi:CubicO group peptidase (beta-lactamase class C family)
MMTGPRRSVVAALLGAAILTPALDAGQPADSATPSPEAAQARIEGRQVPSRQGYDPFALAELMERFHVPGVSVAVIHDFRIHWAKGYGVADIASGDPVTPGTRFQAASISKPVTAVAIVRLVQQRTLDLDDDVNTYLRSWKVPGNRFTSNRPVTLRALLSHTSGAGDGFGFPGYLPSEPRPSVPQILAGDGPSNVGPVFWERPPGGAQKYSGGGTTIVQLALTETLGRPFPDLMRELVLEPFGMRDSAYEQPLSAERDRTAARAHDGRGRAREAKWHVYPELAAAGLWTTSSDLARFGIEVQQALRRQSTLLGYPTVLELVSPVGTGPFAVGFSIERRGEGWYFGHGGSNWGFQCDLLLHRSKGYGVAVMTNADSGRAVINEVEARVAAAYGWDSLDKPVPR